MLSQVGTTTTSTQSSLSMRCPGIRENNEWFCSANILARRPLAITFDGPSPTVLHVTLVTSQQGEFAIAAIPYPPSAVLTVTLWGATKLPAVSVDDLDAVHSYYYDTVTGNLLLYLYDQWNTPSSAYGISMPDGWVEYIITADWYVSGWRTARRCSSQTAACFFKPSCSLPPLVTRSSSFLLLVVFVACVCSSATGGVCTKSGTPPPTLTTIPRRGLFKTTLSSAAGTVFAQLDLGMFALDTLVNHPFTPGSKGLPDSTSIQVCTSGGVWHHCC